MTLLAQVVERGIGAAPITNDQEAEDLVLSPDFLMIDLGRCTPATDVLASDDALAHLLMLDLSPQRQVRHVRNPQLGLKTTDWLGLSSHRFLFCETDRPWPISLRVRRMTQHRSVILWRLYSAIELARMQKLLASYMANRFEAAGLAMVRAENKSGEFLQTLLKANFYDDRIVTLAMDHANVREQIHGREADLYRALGEAIRLEEQEKRLQEATKDFLASVKAWKPGVSKLLDLVKLIPGK